MVRIKDLVVLPKLAVHGLAIEPKRVKAFYTINKADGSSVETELIYSYNQKYFDKKSWDDINLASMMVAQVAINYGLFFETIEFEGVYDETDKHFIRDMVENTCREILVNKFYIQNEFLKPPFDQLQPETLPKYTAADIVFKSPEYLEAPRRILDRENPDYNKFAILSSGGKDSLLTYGIINEIGEPHPVFINESGRHWFTAVNAHNWFKEYEPNTAKPWCNSDRLFNWMLRQLPFIKENFQNIRADIYPIRLWTVAVFLFGVLPVARKRGLGNILIGNEYDTTIKGNFKGISHYNALYDQSKYFDNALSRYYHKKGWNIYQYSILRSLSEMLILKILVKRYPDLQKLQVSCHAAHEENGRMLPCGNCEKCRRIVGMLKSLDETPERCGYRNEQISKALSALSQRSVKQIGSDAAHLYHLLLEKDLVPNNEHTQKLAKSHPEIMKLRFDKERSNLEDLPEFIRKPIIKIYQKYSDGSVKLTDRKWIDYNPIEASEEIPYFLNKKHENAIQKG